MGTSSEEYQIGLQMYSVKHIAEEELMSTLKKIKDIGYKSVELVGNYTYKPVEIRKLLKKLSLSVPSMHVPLRIYDEQYIEKDFEKSAKIVAEIGAEYIVIPWLPIRNSCKSKEISFLQQLISTLQGIAKRQKLKLALHNYSREFVTKESGEYVLDKLIDPAVDKQIFLELDLSMVYINGLDPFKVYEKYEDKTPLLHIRTVIEGRKDGLIADGAIDYQKHLAKMKNLKQKVIYIEQQVHNQKAIDDAKQNFQYISELLSNNSSEEQSGATRYLTRK